MSTNTHRTTVQIDESLLSDPSKYQPITVSGLFRLPVPVWQLHGILQSLTVAFLYGDTGTAKSFIALAWAICIALGLPWLDRKTVQGPVFYIAAEGLIGYKRRVTAFCKHFGIDPTTLDGKLFFIPLAVPLMSATDVDECIEKVKDTLPAGKYPGAIIFDTLSMCLPGEDESSTAVGSRVTNVGAQIKRDLRCLVLFVHHDGKDGTKGLRGSSAFAKNADIILRTERDKKDKNKITLTTEKQKDSDIPVPILLTLEPVTYGAGEFDNSCVILPRTAIKPAPTRPNKVQQRMLEALTSATTYTDWYRAVQTFVKSTDTFTKYVKALKDMDLVKDCDLTMTRKGYERTMLGEPANITM
jgi:hypothetical protein